MKRRIGLIAVFGLLLYAGGTWMVRHEHALLRSVIEKTSAVYGKDVLTQPLSIQDASLEPGPRLVIKGIRGSLKQTNGNIAFSMDEIRSEDPLTNFLFISPVCFRFYGLKLSYSSAKGTHGRIYLRPGPQGFMDLQAEILGMDFQDLLWLDPDHLDGATGNIQGTLRLKAEASADPVVGLELHIPEPGGLIHSEFFDPFLTYLPKTKRKTIRSFQKQAELVQYANARLKASLLSADTLKVFLHILIPEYNLDLNLNMKIRLDKKNAFAELAQILGLVQIHA